MVSEVFLGIGSNVGDKLSNIRKAIVGIKEIRGVEVTKISPFYLTSPVGPEDQDWFVNGVLSANTTRTPWDLLSEIFRIEKYLGRKRDRPWGPRTIDIDILFYGDLVLTTQELVIPHPELHKRAFVLVPLRDIAPNFVHPVLGLSVKELNEGLNCKDQKLIYLGSIC